jgi:hypothetical protein
LVQGADLAVLRSVCGHHDDRGAGPPPHAATHVYAVDVGEAEIQDDDRRVLARALVQGVLTAAGDGDLIAARLQAGTDDACHLPLVLDDEDELAAAIHGAPAS